MWYFRSCTEVLVVGRFSLGHKSKQLMCHVFHSVVPEWPLQAITDVLDRENDSERQTQNEVRILLCTYNIAGTSPGKI